MKRIANITDPAIPIGHVITCRFTINHTERRFKMDPVAECEVVRWVAGDVQLFRILVMGRVPVASGDEREYHLAWLERVPRDLDIFLRYPASAVYWTCVPEQLFDR